MRKRFAWTPGLLLLYVINLIDRFKKRYDLPYRARAPELSFAKNFTTTNHL